jgi:hypothetical protein
MAKQNQRELPADLARVRDRLTAWRRSTKPRCLIPDSLWEAAVKLAKKHGLHRTARTLKLDYYSLKKRVEKVESERDGDDSAFVELPSAFAAVPECVIEWEDSAGTWRVHLKGYNATDIAVVGRGLRGAD